MKFKFTYKNMLICFDRIFTIKNIIKIFVIFIIRFLGITFMVNYFNIDMFYDYASLPSILYYINMAIFSISLSEFFITLSDISIGDVVKVIKNIVKAVKDIVISIYDKCHMTLDNFSLDTKSYKEMRSLGRKYIHAMDINNAGGITNPDNNLSESSRLKGKVNVGESDMVPVDPNTAILILLS